METKKHVFTAAEKKCFLFIIKKFSRIIEDKRTDGSTIKKKNEAWDKVTAEFNESPIITTQATHKQLRRLWMNLKHRQLKAIKRRPHRLVSAGEPSTSDDNNDPDVSIVAPNYEFNIEKEYSDLSRRAEENHKIEVQILREQLRESAAKGDCSKQNIAEEEFRDRRRRAEEKHIIELQILREQLRESTAKADLAELNLRHKLNLPDIPPE